jgi:hypothetical protein
LTGHLHPVTTTLARFRFAQVAAASGFRQCAPAVGPLARYPCPGRSLGLPLKCRSELQNRRAEHATGAVAYAPRTTVQARSREFHQTVKSLGVTRRPPRGVPMTAVGESLASVYTGLLDDVPERRMSTPVTRLIGTEPAQPSSAPPPDASSLQAVRCRARRTIDNGATPRAPQTAIWPAQIRALFVPHPRSLKARRSRPGRTPGHEYHADPCRHRPNTDPLSPVEF